MSEAANFGVVQVFVAKRQQVRAGFHGSGILAQTHFLGELAELGLCDFGLAPLRS
ncbi:MAG: hypothetical protein V2J55_11280 [Candidatus Competibacteraceae bacterium]|nr:hypothetical protein [Candidatus Competibacteraceae bacterium]